MMSYFVSTLVSFMGSVPGSEVGTVTIHKARS